MNVKTWGLTETGSVFHSFNGDGQALCRSNIKAGYMFNKFGGMVEFTARTAGKLCASCAKKEAAHRARAEASMAPVNPYDQVCEGVETPEGAALAAGDECETVTDPDAMRKADDALSFAMTAGAPGTDVACCEHAGMYHGARGCDECGCSVPRSAGRAGNGAVAVTEAAEVAQVTESCGAELTAETDEFEDTDCVDGEGNFYPEHSEDAEGGECRRCGAELTAETDEFEDTDCVDNGRSGQSSPQNGGACPECGRRTGHKLDCSAGRRTAGDEVMSIEHKTGQDIDLAVLAWQSAVYSKAPAVRKLAEWLDAE